MPQHTKQPQQCSNGSQELATPVLNRRVLRHEQQPTVEHRPPAIPVAAAFLPTGLLLLPFCPMQVAPSPR
jgi:hypothetical protein